MIRGIMIKNAWRHLGAFALALPRRLFEDRLTQAAGSLTYTTLLSIVPLLAVALALSTAFPAFDRVIDELRNYLVKNFLPEARGVHAVVGQLNNFAAGAGKLTGVGLAVLGVTAVMLMLSIDDILNRLFRVEHKRSLSQRIVMYGAFAALLIFLIWVYVSWLIVLVGATFTATLIEPLPTPKKT